MPKNLHEIRDPIHTFIHLDSSERRILDSEPVQRLRHIHQLAMSYLVYPGATHKRLEHSLGVMELASRIYDVVTRAPMDDSVREQLPQLKDPYERDYWRRVLRMAALCHDIGHLPFSHAAEKELLPEGWTHERLTREIVLSEQMRGIWDAMIPPMRPEHIARIAVGQKESKGEKPFNTWENILSEIIIGDSLGADRMDYLLRDSHHCGVAYSRFDHYRLVDTLRILATPNSEAALGLEEGGIQSAEALLWARYLMYSQVYLHSVRRIYDIHLKDFLKGWLSGGFFSTGPTDHLYMTDNEVMSALLNASRNKGRSGHDAALRIVNHDHFKCFYKRHPQDIKKNPEAAKSIFLAAREKFGHENVRFDSYSQKGGIFDFPVQMSDGSIVSSHMVSDTLGKIPLVAIDYIHIIPSKREEAEKWLNENRSAILEIKEKEQ